MLLHQPLMPACKAYTPTPNPQPLDRSDLNLDRLHPFLDRIDPILHRLHLILHILDLILKPESRQGGLVREHRLLGLVGSVQVHSFRSINPRVVGLEISRGTRVYQNLSFVPAYYKRVPRRTNFVQQCLKC